MDQSLNEYSQQENKDTLQEVASKSTTKNEVVPENDVSNLDASIELLMNISTTAQSMCQFQYEEATREIEKLTETLRDRATSAMIQFLQLEKPLLQKRQSQSTDNKPCTESLKEIDKKTKQLEKRSRILARHIKEHKREQNLIIEKLDRIYQTLTRDLQKTTIQNLLDRVPTDNDIRLIDNIRAALDERKRINAQISTGNMKISALNKVLAGMHSTTQTKLSKNSNTRVDLPDFTTMPLQEREEFLKKSTSRDSESPN